MSEQSTAVLRECTRCRRALPLDSFWRHPRGRDGIHSHCIECKQAYIAKWRESNRERETEKRRQRIAALPPEALQAYRDDKKQKARIRYERESWRWKRDRLLKQYGLTVDEYEDMVRAQGNRCAICGEPPSEADKGCLHVDHCHTTGAVRGLLCAACNNGLGRFRDDPNVMARAIAYLTEKR